MSQISIIVPVYNTGKYLQRCIDSILNQTYTDLEIIIVDDGSEPETSKICDKLATTDTRIHLYHKQNEGVSVARNYGLARASGNYIGFVDSDDWISPDMYEHLISYMRQQSVDIVYCDALTVWDDKNDELDTFTTIPSSQLILKRDITPSRLFEIAGSVFRGLYRREILNEIQFPVGLKFSEDRYFNLQVLSKCISIYYLKTPYYYRYMRVGSCVNSYHFDAVQIASKGFDLLAEYADGYWGRTYYDEYRRRQQISFVGFFYGALHCGKGIEDTYREVRRIASSPILHELIQKYGTEDKRLKLAYQKRYFLLFVLVYVHGKLKRY